MLSHSCANPAWLHIGRKWRQHPQQRRRQERFKGHIRQRQRIVVHLGGHDSLKAAPNPPILPGLTRSYQVLPAAFAAFAAQSPTKGLVKAWQVVDDIDVLVLEVKHDATSSNKHQGMLLCGLSIVEVWFCPSCLSRPGAC